MTAPVAPIADVDPRPRRLLERYASITGGIVFDAGDDLLEFQVPACEAHRFNGRDRLVIGLTPNAVDESPEAEILVVGSALLQQVIDAIRDRGTYDDRGPISPTVDVTPSAAILSIPVEGTTDGVSSTDLALLPVGRLLARVSIQAGPSILERLVESSIVDLSVGQPVGSAVAQACDSHQNKRDPSQAAIAPVVADRVNRRPVQELLPLLLADLERQLKADLDSAAADAQSALTAELARLDTYYKQATADIDPDEDRDEARARGEAIAADHRRRRADEEHRYSVRVAVHPIQLIEWLIPTQRVRWRIHDSAGISGEIAADRMLVGDIEWHIRCPVCGAVPTLLRVCREGHVACGSCSDRCGVCEGLICRDHGMKVCGIEGHPVCNDHAHQCPVCDRVHCDTHSALCVAHNHRVCTECIITCARCNTAICRTHGVETRASNPKGRRWLCAECVVLCEGGSNEPIGLDEAIRCTTCERHICTEHAVACAVDQAVHCSTHLRRSDHDGRLVCEKHRAACAAEPDTILASDEVAPCATCGASVCAQHGGECAVDRARHCQAHLAPLRDSRGELACAAHRSTCSIDGQAFILAGTRLCGVCGKPACPEHLRPCASCGRATCIRHVDGGRCVTCGHLVPLDEPGNELVAASLDANGGEPTKAKAWRSASDATHTVVELDLGWGRRLLFTVRRGDSRADTIIYQSLLGRERRR